MTDYGHKTPPAPDCFTGSLANYIQAYLEDECEGVATAVNIYRAISAYESDTLETLGDCFAGELENCREELQELQARETANSDCLEAIESRLFPMCIPAKELSADDLAYICEQFEKLEF